MKSDLRVVFMGTPEFAVPSLEAVHKNFSVVAVYSQPDKPVGRGMQTNPTPVKEKALALGLTVFQPEKLSTPEEFFRLSELKPDVIVVVAYGKLLRPNILGLPRLGCVNVHSSLLPRWRGAAPIQWAIMSGDRKTGVTTMLLAEEMDAGDILKSLETDIAPNDTAKSLHDRLSQMGADLIVPTLNEWNAQVLKPTPQNQAQVTFAPKLTKEMELLNTDRRADELALQVRALNPWPGTSVVLETGERLKIKEVQVKNDLSGKAGTLFESFGSVLIGCKVGSLEVTSLQWEGKKPVDASGFLNGLRGAGKSLPIRLKRVG